jgi:hypothetical protein
VEPTFGDIKQNMGFRKLLLRTKPKVNIEVSLAAIAHNIKKIKSFLQINQMAFQLAQLERLIHPSRSQRKITKKITLCVYLLGF